MLLNFFPPWPSYIVKKTNNIGFYSFKLFK